MGCWLCLRWLPWLQFDVGLLAACHSSLASWLHEFIRESGALRDKHALMIDTCAV